LRPSPSPSLDGTGGSLALLDGRPEQSSEYLWFAANAALIVGMTATYMPVRTECHRSWPSETSGRHGPINLRTSEPAGPTSEGRRSFKRRFVQTLAALFRRRHDQPWFRTPERSGGTWELVAAAHPEWDGEVR
jgi:hypothetical protein